uniref:Long-chain-fatty-acid--CoA ligase n=1 Tax=Ascaris lumbricoides TaxID=6252 RepID=A0A9J2P5Q8_ASCLU
MLFLLLLWDPYFMWPRNGSRLGKESLMTASSLENELSNRRSGILLDTDIPVSQFDPRVVTLYDLFMKGLNLNPHGQCLGYRPAPKQPYRFLTYTEVFQHARDFGSALITKVGLTPGNETRVGIYGKNGPQWFMTAFGCVQQSIVIVPLYDTLGPEAVTYIIQQTEMSTIIVDTVEKAKKLLKREDLPLLVNLIIIEENGLSELKTTDHNLTIYSFNELVNEGHQNSIPMTLPKADDTYIICYTSGTTGFPKGVILSHKNMIASISAFYLLLSNFAPQYISPSEVAISYLPLSHTFEQMSHWCIFMLGASTAYYSGNIQQLNDDLMDVKPTIFPVVPRLLNRFYDLIQVKLKNANPLLRAIYSYAYNRKLSLLKRGIACNDTVWDKLIFRKIQAQIGGRVHLIATGSAPVSAEVLETCRIVLGAVIVEGYGQTECTGLVTSTWPGDFVGGHCGGPSTCTLLKLADVPELQYYASQGKGEVMIKGPHCTAGYFKDPEKTAELFDEDGFIHTGDIGQILPDGSLKIIDRKKHIFKLAQGEYVAPEKIENIYMRAPCVQQVYVDGNSLERFLVAIVVPDEGVIKKWFKQNVENNGNSYMHMLQTKEVQRYVLEELQKIGKESGLNSIEQVKAIYLTSDAFSVENGLLTPTLKARRPQLRAHYASVINDLYKAINQ